MTLEAYAKARKEHQGRRSSRTAGCAACTLGEHVTLQFEDETTIRYQIQEMLRIEKIFEEEGIQQRDRRLRAAGARRQQLEGDDADRVPRRRTSASASWRG